jgi:hypothetical protein
MAWLKNRFDKKQKLNNFQRGKLYGNLFIEQYMSWGWKLKSTEAVFTEAKSGINDPGLFQKRQLCSNFLLDWIK